MLLPSAFVYKFIVLKIFCEVAFGIFCTAVKLTVVSVPQNQIRPAARAYAQTDTVLQNFNVFDVLCFAYRAVLFQSRQPFIISVHLLGRQNRPNIAVNSSLQVADTAYARRINVCDIRSRQKDYEILKNLSFP